MFRSNDINDHPVSYFVSKNIQKLIGDSGFHFYTITSEDVVEINEADELIQEIFPSQEAYDYMPSVLLNNDDSYCMGCSLNGVLMGCLVFSVNQEQQYAILHTLAIDHEHRNKKLGSLFMLCLHDICNIFSLNDISLISSNYGKAFYKSFDFKELAHNSFECKLPISIETINKKMKDIELLYEKNVLKRDSTKSMVIKPKVASLSSQSIFLKNTEMIVIKAKKRKLENQQSVNDKTSVKKAKR